MRILKYVLQMARNRQKHLEETFLLAAERRDLKTVMDCLNKGASPNCRAVDSMTAIHIAAERGDILLGMILIRCRDLDINIKTSHGYTPLILACTSRQDHFAKFLLEQGANVNLTECLEKTPLHHIVMVNCISIAVLLISHGAHINAVDSFRHTPLSEAVIETNYLPMVKLLIAHGADVNFNRGPLTKHLYLEACLVCTTEKQIDVIAFLVNNGVDPNTIDPMTGRNALHIVALTGYLPLARQLSKFNVDSTTVDKYKSTPRNIAFAHENLEMFDFLDDLYCRQIFTLENLSLSDRGTLGFVYSQSRSMF